MRKRAKKGEKRAKKGRKKAKKRRKKAKKGERWKKRKRRKKRKKGRKKAKKGEKRAKKGRKFRANPQNQRVLRLFWGWTPPIFAFQSNLKKNCSVQFFISSAAVINHLSSVITLRRDLIKDIIGEHENRNIPFIVLAFLICSPTKHDVSGFDTIRLWTSWAHAVVIDLSGCELSPPSFAGAS